MTYHDIIIFASTIIFFRNHPLVIKHTRNILFYSTTTCILITILYSFFTHTQSGVNVPHGTLTIVFTEKRHY